MRHRILGAARRLLQAIDIRLTRLGRVEQNAPPGHGCEAGIERFLRELPLEPAARAYLNTHLARLTRTLNLVPPHGQCALELGSYLQGAAVLTHVLGYREVRGAYYAEHPGRQDKSLALPAGGSFHLTLDLFDAERHPYPYPDGAFDLVLCCELIEHLRYDPMHLLFECHRILAEGALLILTTPNVASLSSISNLLLAWHNPQIFAAYPPAGQYESPHVREYTARELRQALEAAGFEIEAIFTDPIPELTSTHTWVADLLAREGFDPELRGEQCYCLARKRTHLPRQRRPSWLYAG
jgi:SAM-dependent methyltransferase